MAAMLIAVPSNKDIAHPAGLVAAGLHPNPCPHADFVSATTHKTLRGPRGGLVLCRQEHAKNLDRMIFPGVQGGPFDNVIAAKAVCFGEALTEGFRAYSAQIIANAKALAAHLAAAGYRNRLPRHRHPPAAAGRGPARYHR